MTEIQIKLVDMLRWFHDLCVENNLRYYAIGGTMLGTARHQGFIPWDDDVDVGMPHEDIEKLRDIISRNASDRYAFEAPETEATDYFYPFYKLYDTSTTLVENTKYAIKRGIYIDIFPLDGTGDTLEESEKNCKKVMFLKNLLMAKVGGFRKGRKFYKNLVVAIFRLIPVNDKKILHRLVAQCKKIKWDDSAWGGNLVGAWGMREIMPREIMGTPKLYKFENIEIYGVQKSDEYLTKMYGDWRKLPPEEKRVTHHDYILCDLNKSYIED